MLGVPYAAVVFVVVIFMMSFGVEVPLSFRRYGDGEWEKRRVNGGVLDAVLVRRPCGKGGDG